METVLANVLDPAYSKWILERLPASAPTAVSPQVLDRCLMVALLPDIPKHLLKWNSARQFPRPQGLASCKWRGMRSRESLLWSSVTSGRIITILLVATVTVQHHLWRLNRSCLFISAGDKRHVKFKYPHLIEGLWLASNQSERCLWNSFLPLTGNG